MTAVIQVKVIPNTAQTKIERWQDGILRIRIRAVPEKGKANEALLTLLAKELKIPKSAVKIVSGHSARIKRVSIEGLTKEEIIAQLDF